LLKFFEFNSSLLIFGEKLCQSPLLLFFGCIRYASLVIFSYFILNVIGVILLLILVKVVVLLRILEGIVGRLYLIHLHGLGYLKILILALIGTLVLLRLIGRWGRIMYR